MVETNITIGLEKAHPHVLQEEAIEMPYANTREFTHLTTAKRTLDRRLHFLKHHQQSRMMSSKAFGR